MYHPLLLSGMTWKNALQFPSQSLWQFCNSSKSKWADSSLIKRTSGYFINSWVAEVISRCAFSLNTNLTFQLQHCSCFRGVRSTRPWRAVLQLLTSTGRHWFYQVGITHSIKLLPTSVPLAFFLYPPPPLIFSLFISINQLLHLASNQMLVWGFIYGILYLRNSTMVSVYSLIQMINFLWSWLIFTPKTTCIVWFSFHYIKL